MIIIDHPLPSQPPAGVAGIAHPPEHSAVISGLEGAAIGDVGQPRRGPGPAPQHRLDQGRQVPRQGPLARLGHPPPRQTSSPAADPCGHRPRPSPSPLAVTGLDRGSHQPVRPPPAPACGKSPTTDPPAPANTAVGPPVEAPGGDFHPRRHGGDHRPQGRHRPADPLIVAQRRQHRILGPSPRRAARSAKPARPGRTPALTDLQREDRRLDAVDILVQQPHRDRADRWLTERLNFTAAAIPGPASTRPGRADPGGRGSRWLKVHSTMIRRVRGATLQAGLEAVPVGGVGRPGGSGRRGRPSSVITGSRRAASAGAREVAKCVARRSREHVVHVHRGGLSRECRAVRHCHFTGKAPNIQATLLQRWPEVFGDGPWRYVRPDKRTDLAESHLAGYEPGKGPRFQWEPELLEARRKNNVNSMRPGREAQAAPRPDRKE